MNLPDNGIQGLIGQEAGWLKTPDSDPGVVISSRVRLARNLAEHLFPGRSEQDERSLVREEIRKASSSVNYFGDAAFFDLEVLTQLDMTVLWERRLISSDLMDKKNGTGVLVGRNQSLDLMINEEDHIRMQSLLPGLDLIEAFRIVDQVDDQLQQRLEMAYSPEWGFLTCCPSNLGTGLRASLLIHLPALVRAKKIEKLLNQLECQGILVRGFYGEGSEVAGDIFQISNRATLGRNELEIIENVERVGRSLMEQELETRRYIMDRARRQTEDNIWRAFGILANARMLSTQEYLELSSSLRLGIALELFPRRRLNALNKLLIITQPAHLQIMLDARMEAPERDGERAKMVRAIMADFV
jgi:protein arginine kinase